MTLHNEFTEEQVHKPFAWEYADEAERLGDASHTGLDVGKWAIQVDDHSTYILTDWEAPTWGMLCSGTA